jgi:hypothetical protein
LNQSRGWSGGLVRAVPRGGSEGGDPIWCGSMGGAWQDEGEGVRIDGPRGEG